MEESPIDGLERLDRAARQWSELNAEIDLRLFQLTGSIMFLSQQAEIDFRGVAPRIGVDIGSAEMRIILMLRRSGAEKKVVRGVDLLGQLLITSGAIAKQLTKLEAKKLIVRSRSKQKRGRLISLTDAGKKVADDFIALGREAFPVMSKAFEAFDESEREQILQLVRRLLAEVERQLGSAQ